MKKILIILISSISLSLFAGANDTVAETPEASLKDIPQEIVEAEMKKLQTTLTAEEIYGLLDEVQDLTYDAKNIQTNILNLEEQIELIKEEISDIDTELNSVVNTNSAELEKYKTTKLDVSETEVDNGEVFQVDLYDLGKKIADEDKDDFFTKYVD